MLCISCGPWRAPDVAIPPSYVGRHQAFSICCNQTCLLPHGSISACLDAGAPLAFQSFGRGGHVHYAIRASMQRAGDGGQQVVECCNTSDNNACCFHVYLHACAFIGKEYQGMGGSGLKLKIGMFDRGQCHSREGTATQKRRRAKLGSDDSHRRTCRR